eukprot:5973352-Heterocapsa_arctica.AAC.1
MPACRAGIERPWTDPNLKLNNVDKETRQTHTSHIIYPWAFFSGPFRRACLGLKLTSQAQN